MSNQLAFRPSALLVRVAAVLLAVTGNLVILAPFAVLAAASFFLSKSPWG